MITLSMKRIVTFFLSLFLILLLGCTPEGPKPLRELLTQQSWRPFQVEADSASPEQVENYRDFLEEMRITYQEAGSYTIEYLQGIAAEEKGQWTLSPDDSLITQNPEQGGSRQLRIEDLKEISFVYSLEDSIGGVRVFCVGE